MLNDEQIKQQFLSCFHKKVVFSENYDSEWENAISRAQYIPVEYLASSLSYQNAYVRCFYEKVINLSIIIYERNHAICAWPLTLIYDNGTYWFSTNEKEILPPIFIQGSSIGDKHSVISDCYESLNSLIRLLKKHALHVNKCQIRCNLLPEMRDTSELVYRKYAENNGEADVITDLYVNLDLDIETIHANLRKSYKSLINKSSQLWKTEIIEDLSEEELISFEQKHIEVAGRKTRSDETWELQRLSVNSGYGFIIKLSDSNGEFVGESLFEHSRDEGLYSVGVYNRDLFNEPVSHVVQWKAIEYMKNLGLKYYKIGQRFYPGRTLNLRQPTEKELSISYFKEGFATDYVQTIVVTN